MSKYNINLKVKILCVSLFQGDDVRGASRGSQRPSQRSQVLRDRIRLRDKKWVRKNNKC